MNDFTTRLVEKLLNQSDNSELFSNALKELIRLEVEDGVNTALKAEIDGFLGYEKYEHDDSGNYRNGTRTRTINTVYGEINVQIPRDRNSLFHTCLLPQRKSYDAEIADTIKSLFDIGLTNSDIVKAVEKVYGASYSRQTVSNITDTLISRIDKFKKRTLAAQYAVIYIDGTNIALRRDTVQKEMVHIALGVRTDGTKEILGYAIAPSESKTIWCELLNDLKKRGINDVALFCTDGLSGMEEAIHERFPDARIQRCFLHAERNISARVRVSDRAEVLGEFKQIAHCRDKETAEEALDAFKSRWRAKYPKIIDALDNNRNLLTFYDFPKEIWSSIYTTNMIESYNKQLKRSFKKKEQFPTEISEEKYLVSQFESYNHTNLNRVHKGFGQCTDYWDVYFKKISTAYGQK